MDNKHEISSVLDEAWKRLSIQWEGEDSNAFYQEYITKMAETADDFERVCSNLYIGAAELAKKLELIERDTT